MGAALLGSGSRSAFSSSLVSLLGAPSAADEAPRGALPGPAASACDEDEQDAPRGEGDAGALERPVLGSAPGSQAVGLPQDHSGAAIACRAWYTDSLARRRLAASRALRFQSIQQREAGHGLASPRLAARWCATSRPSRLPS